MCYNAPIDPSESNNIMSQNLNNFRMWKWKSEEDADIRNYLEAVNRVCIQIDRRMSDDTDDALAILAKEMVIHVIDARNAINRTSVYGYHRYSYREDIKTEPNANLFQYAAKSNSTINHPEIEKLTDILNKTSALLESVSIDDKKECAEDCLKSANTLRVEPISSSVLLLPRVLALFCVAIGLRSIHHPADCRENFGHRLTSNLFTGLFYYLPKTAPVLHQNICDAAIQLKEQVYSNSDNQLLIEKSRILGNS